LIENELDSKTENIINNRIILIFPIEYKTYNIILTDKTVNIISSKPDILFLILMKTFLKKPIIDPIITTGWIFVGISPKTTSIAIETNRDNMIKINKFNEFAVPV
jgi:hypothetical protein